jgi:hypothetical protein
MKRMWKHMVVFPHLPCWRHCISKNIYFYFHWGKIFLRKKTHFTLNLFFFHVSFPSQPKKKNHKIAKKKKKKIITKKKKIATGSSETLF